MIHECEITKEKKNMNPCDLDAEVQRIKSLENLKEIILQFSSGDHKQIRVVKSGHLFRTTYTISKEDANLLFFLVSDHVLKEKRDLPELVLEERKQR